MWQLTISVEANGIVLFDPYVVRNELGKIRRGTNLFKRFTTTDEGDSVLARGLFLPVLAIDDAGYDVHLRLADERSRVPAKDVVCENGIFALRVLDTLVVADLEYLMNWDAGAVNNAIEFPSGMYGVRVRGFSARDLSTAGYEFVFTRGSRLPKVTGETGARMRVPRMEEKRPTRGPSRTP